MGKISAMILAGGRGARMGSLCNSKPKPALPYAGKYRVIDFSLSNCLNSGIRDVAVLTGYQRSYLDKYVKKWHSINAPEKNIALLAAKNGCYRGTADAVYQNLNYLTKQGADTILVLAADHIYQMDYRKMLDFHRAAKADVTVGVISVPIEDACHFGNVQTDAENRITRFVEKPVKPLSNLVSMGIYIFNKLPLFQHLIEDAGQADSIHDFGHVILPQLIKSDRVLAYEFNDYWRDIGNPEAYFRANLELLHKSPAITSDGNWPIFTADKKQTQKMIATNQNIKNSKIGLGCVIKGRVENCIVSSGVWIGENALIKNSVIMANASIGRHTVVNNAILDEEAIIGSHCDIGIELPLDSRLGGLTVVGKNMKVPAYSRFKHGGEIVTIPQHPSSFFNKWMVEATSSAVESLSA